MFYFSDAEIDSFINEDLPFFDITTNLAELKDISVTIRFVTREDGVLSGSEEAGKIFTKLDCAVLESKKPSSVISTNETIMSVLGDAPAVFAGWKVAQNILEYSSGVSTLSKKLVTTVKNIDPNIEIVATRKTMPGAKKLLIKAIMAGRAMPHRLGLSESVLFFEQHIEMMGGWGAFAKQFPAIRQKAKEKKIIIEVSNHEEAMRAISIGADIVQVDKVKPSEAREIVDSIKRSSQSVLISLAGGITLDNVEQYARSGADILVTSSLYHAKPLDITTKITLSE